MLLILIRKFFRLSADVCLILAIFGLLQRLTIRDAIPVLAAVFYATPWPVIGLLAMPSALFRFRADLRLRKVALTICAFGFVGWAAFDVRWASGSGGGGDSHRVIFWNPDNYVFSDMDEAFAYVQSVDADTICIIEGLVDFGRQERLFARLFPDHHVHLLDGGMVILSKLEVGEIRFFELDRNTGYGNRIELHAGLQTLVLFMLDMASNPLLDRRQAFKDLTTLLDQEQAQSNVLLIGDFNVPQDSILLGGLRRRMRSAFHEGGKGSRATFPMGFPVLSIDQAWVSGSLDVVSWQAQNVFLSRHRPVLLELRLFHQEID